ncbi:MAG TPA: hypothetical protein VFA41_02480 [Ktedonobacteraceae bacterium]|nr:hypothetical protein [Ktedonobacteraceae bacterium]
MQSRERLFAPRRSLALIAALVYMIVLTSVSVLHVYANTTAHGCASPTPAVVPGSPAPAPATAGTILINEVLSQPGSTWNCAETNNTYSIGTDSWVELYNPQSQPFNLYAAHATLDSGSNTPVYYLPFGASIAAHGYLVLFPGRYSGMLIAGANLRLVINAVAIDQVSIPALGVDQSYARVPDGSSTWQITSTPTINASNTSAQPTPTPASSGSGTGSGSGQGGNGSGYRGNNDPTPTPAIVNGKQPSWNQLQFPPTATASTPAITVSQHTPASTTSSDLPRRILLTVLVIALAGMLFWCWKLFSTS